MAVAKVLFPLLTDILCLCKQYMFSGAESFNQNIGGWNVERVERMEYMFSGAESFNQNIGGWKVRKVVNMVSLPVLYFVDLVMLGLLSLD